MEAQLYQMCCIGILYSLCTESFIMTNTRPSFFIDDCGQNALQLASRASALIAEILRLSEYIPGIFTDPNKNDINNQLVSDFNYFTNQDIFEKNIQSSSELLQADDKFKKTHIELLERFFLLLKSIYNYITEVNRYIEDIKNGLYLSQSVESIISDSDGKQMIAEIYYLYGVILLLLDYRIGGKVREYLIVSYLRYIGLHEHNTTDICNLFKDTGFKPNRELPKYYPAAYFNRVKLDYDIVQMVIARIRSEDIYQMSYHFPASEHRSTALANQSAMLYVLLFFTPKTLRDERQIMREIVNKHFMDNWVINYYMGFTVDLSESWSSFKAASDAIKLTLQYDNITYYQEKMRKRLQKSKLSIQALLREGILTEQYVLDNIHTVLLPELREANVALRWLILHTTRENKGSSKSSTEFYNMIKHDVSNDDILSLLFSTSQLEFNLRAMFENLLKEKKSKWNSVKEECISRMLKLSTYFSGDHVLSNNIRVAELESWFQEISEKIESISYSDSVVAGRQMQKVMKALNKVQEFHQIDSNIHVMHFITETTQLLRQMLRYINIERRVLISIAVIGDLSFAWELLSVHHCYLSNIWNKIKQDPSIVIHIRSTFIKLASTLELPCARIDQVTEYDSSMVHILESVSEYYSAELVAFVRKILQVLPLSIFNNLKHIVDIFDNLLECPSKLPKKDLVHQAQLELRQSLSTKISQIANYANGILAMESTLVGVIEVDPHQLLEDGIRRELVSLITTELHNTLKYDKLLTSVQYVEMMNRVSATMTGLRNGFEHIQDFINVHGLKVWDQEMNRIINFNVEMECNNFFVKKVYHWNSKYQSDTAPIPYFDKPNKDSIYSFLGAIIKQLLMLIQSGTTIVYIPHYCAWFDFKKKQEIVGNQVFKATEKAIGSRGLAGLDKLLSFIVAKELRVFYDNLSVYVEPLAPKIETFEDMLHPLTGISENLGELYKSLIESIRVNSEWVTLLIEIGQCQLLRCNISNELRIISNTNGGLLYQSLKCANKALKFEIEQYSTGSQTKLLPDPVVSELYSFFQLIGFTSPASTVYITTNPISELPVILVSYLIQLLPYMSYNSEISCLVGVTNEDRSKKENKKFQILNFEPVSFCTGLVSLLKQFHSEFTRLFIMYTVQYIRYLLVQPLKQSKDFNTNNFNNYSSLKDIYSEDLIIPQSAVILVRFISLFSVISSEKVSDIYNLLPLTLRSEIYKMPIKAKSTK